MANPDLDKLKAILLNSRVQVSNNALFQVINQILDALKSLISIVSSGSGGGGGISNLIAGDFIQLVTANGQTTINGAEWSVLTNGDLVTPELIFAGGDVIMTHTLPS